jgi:cell division transport system ATP-binding protein
MIEFQHVSVCFEWQTVLQDVSFTINPGEFVSLIGETGAGKTTLFRLLYFDLLPDEGVVRIAEYTSDNIKKRQIPKVRRKLGVVFQDYKLLEDRNVFENVGFPLEVTGMSKEEAGKRVLRVLSDVGLSHKRSSMLNELSGGEQQRVAIARALVNEPMILLADEPTGNLDPSTALEILELLKTINRTGTAVLLASHNYEIVRRSGSRILQLTEGRLTELQTI